jgi:DNA polymerase-1
MQGTAADLIKLSMNAVQAGAGCEKRATKMIMQVHDELVFEVPQSEVDWVQDGDSPPDGGLWRDLKVPLLAEVGVGS